MGWRNLFSSCAVCCVSFWFWREKGFGSNTHVLLRVQYSCGGALVFCLQWEIVVGVLHILSVQYRRDYYYFYHRSDLCKIIRFLREIECNEFVLVLFKIDLIHFEHPIIISSI